MVPIQMRGQKAYTYHIENRMYPFAIPIIIGFRADYNNSTNDHITLLYYSLSVRAPNNNNNINNNNNPNQPQSVLMYDMKIEKVFLCLPSLLTTSLFTLHKLEVTSQSQMKCME